MKEDWKVFIDFTLERQIHQTARWGEREKILLRLGLQMVPGQNQCWGVGVQPKGDFKEISRS